MPKNVVHKAYTTITAFLGATKAAGEFGVVHNTTVDSRFDLVLQSDANVALYESKMKPVPTVAELAVLTPTRYPAASVTADLVSRNGVWKFSSADLSAAVTADPDQRRYVAPSTDTSGSTGAWINQEDGRIRRANLGLPPAVGFRRLAERYRIAWQDTPTVIRAVAYGDSVAGNVWSVLGPMLHAGIGGLASGPVNDGTGGVTDISNVLIRGVGYQATLTGGNVTNVTTATDVWPTGEVMRVTAGTATVQYAGGTPAYSGMYIFWVKKAGAGTFDLKTGGSVIASYNADNGGAVAAGSHYITQTHAATVTEIVVTAGTVDFVVITGADLRTSGLWTIQFAVSGQTLQDQMANVGARTMLQGVLSIWGVDLFSFEMKENSSWYATELVKLRTILDAGAPLADKIFCLSNPYTPAAGTSAQTDQTLQNDQLRDFVLASNDSYHLLDTATPYGAPANVIGLNLMSSGDSTHPVTAGQIHAASMALAGMINPWHPHCYATQPVNAQHKPSYFGDMTWGERGTFFGAVEKVVSLKLEPTYRLDSTFTLGRKMEWKDTTGALLARVSNLSGIAGGWESMMRGNLITHADNAGSLGVSATRWSVVYAATGTINTSDERHKQDIAPIDDAVLDAWGDVEWVQYRWIDAVTAKHDKARVHFGLIAQRVKEVFEKHGLDPFRYAILCYDAWDGTTLQPDPKTGEMMPVETGDAADRYGIRYDLAQAIEAAYQRRRLNRIEGRLP